MYIAVYRSLSLSLCIYIITSLSLMCLFQLINLYR